jgi:hypothetical protein
VVSILWAGHDGFLVLGGGEGEGLATAKGCFEFLASDEPRVSAHPVFELEGDGLAARYYEDYVTKGRALAGEPLDPAGEG